MGYTKGELLAKLKDLQIQFSQYEHPVVLTVEAQAKYVGHLGGGLSKNIFLKDKKSRFYMVSALADTKLDLKVLSQRLGLGKGNLRMAHEEALGSILQVPLGCVTPFALVNESARDVSLLLDKGFKKLEHCFFHPLSNDMSISLNACELDKFLKSIGRDPSYVDLEENPAVGKDQPPDLASLVPSGSVSVPDHPEKTPSSKVPSKENHVSTNNKSPATPEKSFKPPATNNSSKDKLAKVAQSSSFADVEQFVQEILHKTSGLFLSEISKTEQGEQPGVVSENIQQILSSDLKNLAMIFKGAAYTEGFHAGIQSQPKRM